MLWKCHTQYASKFGRLISGQRTGKGQFSFQSQRKAMPKNAQSEIAQSCLTLCDPMDRSIPGFSIHGFFQARVLEWVAISFSWRSSRLRDWAWVFHIIGRRFTVWATKEVQTTAQLHSSHMLAKKCSKFTKPGFNSTLNYELPEEMFKMDLEKAEEPEIKLPTSAGS